MTDAHRATWQFTLQSLFAATVFVALGLWAWNTSRFAGVALLATFVGIVAVNLAIAFHGAKFQYGVVAGTLGGAVLWSLVAVVVGMLDAGVFTLDVSLMYAFFGILAGVVCGSYAKRRCRQTRENQRRGLVICGCLLFALLSVVGAGRYLARLKLLQDDFVAIHDFEPDSDGTYRVEYWGNGITDESLSWQLAEIPSNRKLAVRFRYTRVTDEGIRPLAGFPNLRSVDLRGTDVSANGIDWLHDRVPNCVIRD